MGSGTWTSTSFATYTTSTKGVSLNKLTGCIDADFTAQELFTSSRLHEDLNPHNIMRECVNTEEHPNTVPVILALDVTGSMGHTAVNVAKQLGKIMNSILEDNSGRDIEFNIMAIGDLAYDHAPIQMSQFESDVRIAEHLDKVYFEGGGGGNGYESYTAAWYMGARHCKLDCWGQGRKGIIITMGDEPLNPYLPKNTLVAATGDKLQENVDTNVLYEEAAEKFDIYHIHVDDGSYPVSYVEKSYKQYLDDEHFYHTKSDNIGEIIAAIINKSIGSGASINFDSLFTPSNNQDTISW